METISIKVQPETKDRIREMAKERGMTVTAFILHLVAKERGQ